MIHARNTDRLLIISTLILVVVGVVMVYSTSYVVATKRFGSEYFFVKKQLIFAAAGIMLFIVSAKIPYRLYRHLAYPILIFAILLLLLIFVPTLSHEAGGARRWIKIMGFTFQPSEFAKFAVIIFLAYSLEAKQSVIKDFYAGFLPNIIIPGVVIALIMSEPDFGTAVTLTILVYVMNFAGGVKFRYLGGLTLAVLPVLYLVVTNFGYMMNRITVFLDPWKDPSGAGFQMVQSFLAFGSGGLSGVGLGEGKQKLFFLPEAHTDFIFSIIGEEMGLIGAGITIALYLAFFISGTRIAMRAKDLFGTYLALGLTLMISLQALVNMAVVMGVVPPKGLTLPFISYGGTSLLVSLFAVGIILNVCIEGNEH
ncbi:MAG: putative lipid II flippase FtsW [Deltaproteobacteria bacterium]|nr:putative lipid II flippase FtsW [Deltaproteobacteria bacterium]